MLKSIIQVLGDPIYVAKIQKFCGVEPVKPVTYDQETQTRNQPSDSEDNGSENSNSRKHSTEINGNDISKNDISKNDISPINQDVKIDPSLAQNCNGGDQMPPSTNGAVRQRYTSKTNGGLHEPNAASTINGFDRNDAYSDFELQSVPNLQSKLHKNGILPCASDMAVDPKDAPRLTPSAPLCQYTVDYTMKYKSLYYLAKFGAFLGNEECFLTFFPFCIWNLDLLIVRQVSYLWCLVMYIGQAAKDWFCWPRPPCPPVVRIETHYLQEFSMPSTHAMAGTSIPFFMAYLAVERYQLPMPIAVGCAMTWFLITCWSRLYLGVHTLLDILVGALTSVAIGLMFLRYIKDYDFYMQTHLFAAPAILATAYALCTVFYPSDFKNSSKGDAVQVVAGVAGCNIGCWLGYQLGWMHEPVLMAPYTIDALTLPWVGIMLLRFWSGTALVVIIYLFMKWWTVPFFSYLQGLDKPDKNNGSVITGYKFLTYGTVGLSISFIIPLIHEYFGIHRTAMFHEVL